MRTKYNSFKISQSVFIYNAPALAIFPNYLSFVIHKLHSFYFPMTNRPWVVNQYFFSQFSYSITSCAFNLVLTLTQYSKVTYTVLGCIQFSFLNLLIIAVWNTSQSLPFHKISWYIPSTVLDIQHFLKIFAGFWREALQRCFLIQVHGQAEKNFPNTRGFLNASLGTVAIIFICWLYSTEAHN